MLFFVVFWPFEANPRCGQHIVNTRIEGLLEGQPNG